MDKYHSDLKYANHTGVNSYDMEANTKQFSTKTKQHLQAYKNLQLEIKIYQQS